MSARQLLLFGGIALAILGMSYGLWYAVFAEHQALDGIGHSLSSGFQAAAERNSAAAENSLLQYRQAKYAYDRQVDVHGHWIGLAMLLIVLAIAFDHVSFPERFKMLLAWALFLGSALFPLGVLMQTWSHGPLPRAIAILGSALVTAALAGMVLGFTRRQDA
jgi:Na+/proline symporter